MMKTYYYVWSYVCFCLQSSFKAVIVVVDFPPGYVKTSSLFIPTNAAPGTMLTVLLSNFNVYVYNYKYVHTSVGVY